MNSRAGRISRLKNIGYAPRTANERTIQGKSKPIGARSQFQLLASALADIDHNLHDRALRISNTIDHAVAASELSRIKKVSHLIAPDEVGAVCRIAVVDHHVSARKRWGGARVRLVGEQLDRLDGGFLF